VVVVVAEHPPFQVEERGKGIFLVNAVQYAVVEEGGGQKEDLHFTLSPSHPHKGTRAPPFKFNHKSPSPSTSTTFSTPTSRTTNREHRLKS
jgi:transcription initiation factor IIF auxiliary subunit